jgi:hypothetical protein
MISVVDALNTRERISLDGDISGANLSFNPVRGVRYFNIWALLDYLFGMQYRVSFGQVGEQEVRCQL